MKLRQKLAENRSPSRNEDNSNGSLDINDKTDINLQSMESSDAPSKGRLNGIVIDSVAADSNQSDQTDDCIVSGDTKNAINEFELHNADTEDMLSTLSHQNDVLGPLSDISGQCLNTAALSIDQNPIIQNGNDKNSTFGGVLDMPSNEFIDVDTQNFLNICLNDKNVNAVNLKPNTKEKVKIQVLSESSSSNLLETTGLETGFEAFSEVNSDENDCIGNIETPNTPVKSREEKLIVEAEADCVERIDGKSQSIPNLSSTITFYCESLDDLKDVDSDSDVDIEEI